MAKIPLKIPVQTVTWISTKICFCISQKFH